MNKLLRKSGWKAVLILGLAVLMLVGGCGGKVLGFICNPTSAEQAEAAKWLTAMDQVQAVAATFFPAAGIAKASAVMTTIAGGGCFLVSELQSALSLLQEAQSAKAKQMGLKAVVVPVSEQFPVLYKTAYGGK